jgi:hypothetical protein
MFVCQHCGTSINLSEPIPRDAECSGCGRDLRACIQCRHYDPALNNSCRETEAEPVVEKERRNFCEFFAPARGARPKADDSSRQAQARAKLEALFGGAASKPPASSDPRARLEALFGGGTPKGGSGPPNADESEADEP